VNDVTADPDIVSKSAFARLANVSAPRVSQWIDERKIFGDGLVGEGRSAKIRISVACQQLKRTLDVAQRLGNGISTRLDLQPPAVPADAEAISEAPQQSAITPRVAFDPIEEKLKREKLAEYERRNRIAAKDEALSDGQLTDAIMAQQQIGRVAAKTIDLIEGGLGDVAEALAAEYGLSRRDVMHRLREGFRKIRASAAASLRRDAEAMPALVEFDLGAPIDEDTAPMQEVAAAKAA
jgi:hypothetical protein